MKSLAKAFDLEYLFSLNKSIEPAMVRYEEFEKTHSNYPFKLFHQYKYKIKPKYKWTNMGSGLLIPIGIAKQTKFFEERSNEIIYLANIEIEEEFRVLCETYWEKTVANLTRLNICDFEDTGLVDISKIKINPNTFI